MISNNYGSLEEAAETGQLHLERLSLEEAEDSFRRVLDKLTSSYPHGDRLRMTSLVGLAEIRVRRCRVVTDDVEQWLHGMLSALALYKEANEIAEANTRRSSSDRKQNSARVTSSQRIDNDVRYFEEVLQKTLVHAKVIENDLVEVVKEQVAANCMKSKPGMYLKKKPVFDVDWLQQLVDYCTTGRQRAKDNQGQDLDNQNNRVREFATHSTTTTTEDKTIETSSYVPIFKRKIDYDRLQEGIKKIVSEVSFDVRGQYLHFKRHAPGQLMQKRLLHELVLRLSPGNRENEDLLNVLEDSVQYEDCSEMIRDEEVESSRKSCCVEENQRTGTTKNRKEEVSEIDSVEWGEIWEKEEKLHRDGKDKEKEEVDEDEEDEEDDDNVDTTELHLHPSALHTTTIAVPQRRYSEAVRDERSVVLRSTNRSIVSFCTRDKELQSEVQSRKQNSDFRYGTSIVSESGQSVGGLSGAFCTSGILTMWRSTRTRKGHPESGCMFRAKELHSFEEVSPLTERDKVLRWLQSVEPEPRPKSLDRDRVATTTQTTHPGSDKVGQAIGHVTLQVADVFRKENRCHEAYEMYKYAMGLFQKYPLSSGQTQMMADLLLRVGMAKCSMGQLATGSQLMEESVKMLERNQSVMKDGLKIAEVWFQVGNVYLADKIRQESLQARIMQLIREDVEDEEKQEDDRTDKDTDEDTDQSDSYCVCIYEALACYKKALAVLDSLGRGSDRRVPELAINIFSNMADCYVMTGNLDLAEIGYEEALRLFPDTHGSPLLTKNAHVLSMLGTVSFLLRNFVRSATMYETANILLQHLRKVEDPTLEMAWTATMLGLSYSSLLHYDKAVSWCIRAFALYTRFFRGKILDVDPLSRWFIVQTLYVLGIAYTTLEANDKSLYYLNLAKNMTTNSSENSQDVHQLVKVLRAIADVYSALEEPAKALEYYEEALEQSKSLGDENTTTALKNQLLNRMAGANVDNLNYTEAGDNLEQALDYQKDVESSIKEDMIAILLKLGVTSTMACDLDKAIGCYTDCIQAYNDRKRKTEPRDVASVMASLGTLCHVKGCMQDDEDDVDAFMNKAERYFDEAFHLTGSSSPVCVQYANYLYQQGRYADALLVMLPYVFCSRPAGDEVCYNGIEQAVLPDHLQYDADDEDTLVLEARIFARFLAILCYNDLGLVREADDVLIQLFASVVMSSKPFNHVMLGYGLMEMGLFEEAAGSFMAAARLQPSGCSQVYSNARLCFLLFAYLTIARAVDFLLEFIYNRSAKDAYTPSFDDQKHYLHIVPSGRRTSTHHSVPESGGGCLVEPRSPSGSLTGTNTSRKFTSQCSFGRVTGSDLGENSKATDEARRGGRRTTPDRHSDGSGDFPISSGGGGAASDEDREREEEEVDEEEEEEDWEEWTTEEVIVETPREILELIANQVNRNRFLNGAPEVRRWNDQCPPTNCPSMRDSKGSLDHANPLLLCSTDSSLRFESSELPLDNAAYTGNRKRDVDARPEVNGNRKPETDSSDEWIVTEEIIETPAEIMALLKRTYSNVSQ